MHSLRTTSTRCHFNSIKFSQFFSICQLFSRISIGAIMIIFMQFECYRKYEKKCFIQLSLLSFFSSTLQCKNNLRVISIAARAASALLVIRLENIYEEKNSSEGWIKGEDGCPLGCLLDWILGIISGGVKEWKENLKNIQKFSIYLVIKINFKIFEDWIWK